MVFAVNWNQEKLGDLFQTQKGFAFKSAWYCDTGHPIVKVSDFTKDSIDASSLTKIPDEVAENYLRYELREGDVVVQTVGSWPSNPASVVGKCIRVPRSAHKSLLNQNAVRLDPNDKIVKRFLYYSLRSPKFCSYIVGTAQGAASQAAITLDAIRTYDLTLPPLTTQWKIAAILSAYDDLIENNIQRIKVLEEMAQNLYREWFVKFRFPGNQKAHFVDSQLGRIPKGWKVVKIGNLIEIRKGKNITKNTIVQGSVPVVAGGMSPAYYHNVSNTRQPVITISASGANAGFVCLYQENVWASDCSVIDMNTTPYVYYFYLQLKHRQTDITRLQRGSAQPHVYPKDLMDLDAIEVPSDFLDRFNQKVTPVIQMIKNLTLRNTTIRRTRDMLLPRLISGEVDVSELDITIPEEAV